MTTPNYPASPGYSGAQTPMSATTGPSTGEPSTADAAKEQAQQTAGTAADETKHVAGVAMGEAKQVAGEAKQHAQNLVGEAKSQVDAQSRTQRDRLVSTLQEFSGQLDGMIKGEGVPSGIAQDAVRQVSDRARGLSSQLEGREPLDLLEEVRNYARRRPGTFLLGAMAAGLVAGRVTRGAKAAKSAESSDSLDSGRDSLGYGPLPTGAAEVGTPVVATPGFDPATNVGTGQATPGFDPATNVGTSQATPDYTNGRTSQ